MKRREAAAPSAVSDDLGTVAVPSVRRRKVRGVVDDPRWEWIISRLFCAVAVATLLMIAGLAPFIGWRLAGHLAVGAFTGVIWFALASLLVAQASEKRANVVRIANAVVESLFGSIALLICLHVKGAAWAGTSNVTMIFYLAIIASAARLRPGLTLFVTSFIITQWLMIYFIGIYPNLGPRLGDAELAAMPTLQPWSALERSFWFAIAGGVAAFAGHKARYFAVFGERAFNEKRRLEKELGRFVSKDVAGAVMRGEAELGRAERREVTVLFCDLRDFTSFCEQHAPEEVVELLNRFYGRACAVIEAHGGTVNKFLGDGLLALFGAPIDHPNHARAAAEAAHDIIAAADELRAQGGVWRKLDIGIGLDTGMVVVGGIGSADRLEYTAIGATVNKAARLQSLSRKARRRIILSRATAAGLGRRANLISLGDVALKGFAEPEPVFAFRHSQ